MNKNFLLNCPSKSRLIRRLLPRAGARNPGLCHLVQANSSDTISVLLRANVSLLRNLEQVRLITASNKFQTAHDAGVPELARIATSARPRNRLPCSLENSFLKDFIEVAPPASPLRWLADVFLGFVGTRRVIESDGREFLGKLFEVNSTPVQRDILNRVQESRGYLEVEIRKVLLEVKSCSGAGSWKSRKSEKQEHQPLTRYSKGWARWSVRPQRSWKSDFQLAPRDSNPLVETINKKG
jgi:hypothetical protein